MALYPQSVAVTGTCAGNYLLRSFGPPWAPQPSPGTAAAEVAIDGDADAADWFERYDGDTIRHGTCTAWIHENAFQS